MPIVTGIDFLIQIEDAANPGTYRTIGGQRGGTLNMTGNTVDTSNKDTQAAGWETFIQSLRGWTLDFDGLWLEDDVAFLDLEDAWFNNTLLNVRLNTPAGNTYTGQAAVATLAYEGPHDDVMAISGSLQGASALTKA